MESYCSDISTYNSYPFEETVRGMDNSVLPTRYSRINQFSSTTRYPIDLSVKENTVPMNPYSIHALQSCGVYGFNLRHSLARAPTNLQFFRFGIPSYLSSPYSTLISTQRHPSHFGASMQSCRFDQTAYTYPLDETVKEVDKSVPPIPFSQVPQYPVPPTGFLKPYPLDQNFKRNTGVRPSQPQQHCFPGESTNSQYQRFVPSSQVPNQGSLSSSDAPLYHLQRHQSQFCSKQRHQTSSFSINQHIGLNEPPVVNASQLNNSIKVQYQFGNNDRFAVQSTSAGDSNDSALLGWQGLSDVYQSQKVTDGLRILPDQPDSASKNNCQKISDHSEIGQYSVFNIPRKNCANIGNSFNVINSLPNSLEEERDCFKQILEKEKGKKKKQTTNVYKKGIETLKQNSRYSLKSLNSNQVKNASEQETGDRLIFNKDSVTNEVNSTGNQCSLDNNEDRHALSGLCGRNDIDLAKKQKAGSVDTSLDIRQALTNSIKTKSKKTESSVNSKAKRKTSSVKKDKKTGAPEKKSISRGKKKSSDRITLLKLTYQCGECTNIYYDIEDLVKHLSEDHLETQVPNEGTSSNHNINSNFAKELNEGLKTDEKINKINNGNLNDSEKTLGSEMNSDLRERKDDDKEMNKGLRQEEGAEDAMTGETVELELIEVDSENMVSEPESFLCPLCGYGSNSLDEEERHQRLHDDESGREKKSLRNESHTEGKGYFTQYLEMIEHQQKSEEERGSPDEKEHKEIQISVCEKMTKASEEDTLQNKQNACGPKLKKGSEKSEPTTNITENSLEKNKTGLRKRKTTQAKNSLMNPSKGKQKRVRDTQNFGEEDKMLMEMFGIIPSKVCLSRVENSDNLESENVKSTVEVPNMEKSNIKKESEYLQEDSMTKNKRVERNHWSKVLNMSNCKEEANAEEKMLDNETFNSDDSDVEIVEPPMTLIVLDDEANIESENKEGEDIEHSGKSSSKKSEKDSPKKTEKDSPKKIVKVSPKKIEKGSLRKLQRGSSKKSDKGNPAVLGKKDKENTIARNVSIDIISKDDTESQEVGRRIKSDAELLEEYGIKNLSINLTSTPPKKKQSKPGPKSQSETSKSQLRESKSTGNEIVKDIEEMSPSEIEKLLYECGMGITVPVQPKTSQNEIDSSCRANQTPSPVPSTSKGHGHLKRKRTARKSTKDSALFKKYKLKDSKVIIENLSRIDVSLIRNPNSPFGKSDWLKHKFDSDTESDFEFDIPTPPLVEEFVENAFPPRNDKQKVADLNTENHASFGKTGRKSPLKQKELQVMEKFGISESVVVIDSPRKSQNVKLSKSVKKKSISDDELRKKFGIPNTMVVIHTPEKTQESLITSGKIASENKHSHISFADFKSALDTARKNILSIMKSDSWPDSPGKRKSGSKQNKTKSIRMSTKKVEQNITENASELKESEDASNLARRKLRIHTNANESTSKCLLPNKLKTLTVNINKLKVNETCKTYKARAVSRAIEAKRKKNKIARELDNNVNKNVNKGTQKTLLSSRKRLRKKVSEDLLEKSSKRERLEIKAKEVGSKEIKLRREIQVVKTARYRRSVLGDKNKDKTGQNIDLKQLTKGLPIVKVTVPCLTNEQIVRLSQNIDNPSVSVKNNVELTSGAVVNEIINEIIDKICLSQDITIENSELSDSIENSFEGNSSVTTSGCGDMNVTDTSVESDFMSGEEKSYSVTEFIDDTDNFTLDSRNIDKLMNKKNVGKKKTDGLHEVVDSESEVSLLSVTLGNKNVGNEKTDGLHEVVDSESEVSFLSVTLENKENENDSFIDCIQKGVNDDNITTGLDKKTSELDVIPLDKIKFYNEDKFDVNVSENLHDEVDGDDTESSRISMKNYVKDEIGTFAGDTKEKPNEIVKNHEDMDLTVEEIDGETGLYDSKTNDVNDEKENRIDDEFCGSELCSVDSKKTFRNTVKENENVSKDKPVMKMQILSAIIDSESGSLIGDVYSVHESAGNSGDVDRQEIGDRKEKDLSRNLLENVSRMSRSSSPEDVIETLTES